MSMEKYNKEQIRNRMLKLRGGILGNQESGKF